MPQNQSRKPEPAAFLIRRELYEQTAGMSDAQLGALLRQILAYFISERMPAKSDDPIVNTAFQFLRPQLDADRQKYYARCALNARIAANRTAKRAEAASSDD